MIKFFIRILIRRRIKEVLRQGRLPCEDKTVMDLYRNWLR